MHRLLGFEEVVLQIDQDVFTQEPVAVVSDSAAPGDEVADLVGQNLGTLGGHVHRDVAPGDIVTVARTSVSSGAWELCAGMGRAQVGQVSGRYRGVPKRGRTRPDLTGLVDVLRKRALVADPIVTAGSVLRVRTVIRGEG